MDHSCWIPRGWAGYVIDIITCGGYTNYRAHAYTKCITQTDSYTRYTPKVDQSLNRIGPDDSLVSKDHYRDTSK